MTTTEKILYISLQTRSPKRIVSGNTVTWPVTDRPYLNRSPDALQLVMLERERTTECRVIISWDTKTTGRESVHTVVYGDIVGDIVDSAMWADKAMGAVETRKNPFRPGWGFQMFATSMDYMKRYGMIPSDYSPLQDQLFALTKDRSVNSGVIRFRFFERNDTPVCVFEALDEMPLDHDEESMYAECDNVRVFTHYLRQVFAIKYSEEHDDYALTEDDISKLISPSEGRLKRVYNKTEKKFEGWLALMDIPYTREAKFDWCRRKMHLRFDFHVKKVLIEIDGRQHFEDVAHFHTVAAEVQSNDKFKAECALDNGFNLVRIDQTDMWLDAFDWRREVLAVITKEWDECVIHYIARTPQRYDAHHALLPDDRA